MRLLPRSSVALVVAVLMTVIVATVTPASGNAASENPPTVRLVEYAIEPPDLTVAAGPLTLVLENVGVRRHNLVLLVDGAELTSPEVRPGDTVMWSLDVLQPGRYLYWCGEYRHLEKGMAGTLTVE